MAEALKIGVVGCAGFMGRNVIQAVLATEDCTVVGGVEPPNSAALGSDLGLLVGGAALGTLAHDDTEALFRASDVVIEFTGADASVRHAEVAAKTGTAHVVGTTGLEQAQTRALEISARKTAIVFAPNMSPAVTLMMALTEQVAATLGPDYDIEIVEMHHRRKVDAPSGTALGLGEAAARGRGISLDADSERGRDGITGARGVGTIGFASLRGGDVVGDHTVVYAGEGERLELTHKASSRQIFARGAVRAARWVAGKPPGLYGMRDVLGLNG